MCFNQVLYFMVINCLIKLVDHTYCITKTMIKHLLRFFKCECFCFSALHHKQNGFMRQNAQLQISDIYKQIILFGNKIVRSLPVIWSIHRSPCIPTLTYGHELGVVTRKPEVSFLQSVSGLRDWRRSSFIQEELGVELKLDTTPILHWKQLVEVSWACPTGRRPPGRSQICWRNYISQLVWEHLVDLQESWRRWLDTRWCGYLWLDCPL